MYKQTHVSRIREYKPGAGFPDDREQSFKPLIQNRFQS